MQITNHGDKLIPVAMGAPCFPWAIF